MVAERNLWEGNIRGLRAHGLLGRVSANADSPSRAVPSTFSLTAYPFIFFGCGEFVY